MLNLRIPPSLVGLAALSVLWSHVSVSQAHFVLESPAAMTQQSDLGNPQKAPPCGDAGNATLTGERTSYAEGATISITIKETIYHPGHYRVALALDSPDDLPPPPPVTAGTTDCGSAPIDPSPSFPVLADGVLQHSSQFAGSQTFEVTLPEGVTCENCTLQIIEFMSNHGLNNPGGCYYHHCANIAITPAGAPGGDDAGPASGPMDAGTSPSGDGGSSTPDPEPQPEDGTDSPDLGEPDPAAVGSTTGGCTLARSDVGTGAVLCLVLLGLASRRSRRRS